jgi:hypothetical protein
VAGVGGYQGIASNGDWASAIGAHTDAEAGVFTVAGQNDGALVFDPFGTLSSTAEAGDGDVDLASVLGDGSSAFAGFPSCRRCSAREPRLAPSPTAATW